MNRRSGLAGLLAAVLALSGAGGARADEVPTAAVAQRAAGAPAAAPTSPAAESSFSPEQLEQMVAPIALYPDALLAQVLMAATYPLEVVQAARFMSANPKLKGTQLEEKLKTQDWDTAVKSMCTVPAVLARMNDNLDWTQDLGDAFLGQRSAVMDAVQRMRNKAYQAGNLKSTDQQVVTQQPDKIIVIEQPAPQVVYVPTYSPTVVYGPTWVYPAPYYPAFYAPVPAGYGFVAFGTGVAVGAAMYGGCSWGWGESEVDIDINENHNFNRSTDASFNRENAKARVDGARGKFEHDPSHRRGVNYRDSKTASQFGARDGATRVSRDQARGFDRAQDRGRGDRAGRAPSQRDVGAGRGGEGARGGRDGQRSAGRDGARTRANDGGRGSRDSALSGSRDARLDRSASSRGKRSLDSSRGAGRGSGAARGGGGRRGGGGGRRR